MEIRTSTRGLEALAHRLGRPVDSLQAYASLNDAELDVLVASLDHAIRARHEALDQALGRVLFWPLRGPILRLLRR